MMLGMMLKRRLMLMPLGMMIDADAIDGAKTTLDADATRDDD